MKKYTDYLNPAEQLSNFSSLSAFLAVVQERDLKRQEIENDLANLNFEDNKDRDVERKSQRAIDDLSRQITSIDAALATETDDEEIRALNIKKRVLEGTYEKKQYDLEVRRRKEFKEEQVKLDLENKLENLNELMVAMCTEFSNGTIGTGTVTYNGVDYTAS
ncbi:hypothetical protein V6R21_14825 [Limibacter armeniacum]|uniref:hypothetical protein n=1 Tax=Limibacter armeniacum TaxID=466084 RepID=UPI002FE565A3